MDFTQVGLILAIAAFFGIIAKLLKQPLLIGYLFAGFFLFSFGLVGNKEIVSSLGKIGVTLLLFLVGLEMNLKEVKVIGKTALITGLGQILFTSIIGFFLSFALGFSVISSIYIAIALTFSSTIIIIKLLSEKNDLNSLYGKISVGFLLVQDLVAVIILMFLSGAKSENFSLFSTFLLLIKAFLLFYLTWFLSKKILPDIFAKTVGRSSELLFIVSTSWALGTSVLVGGPLGFSFEIGGFLAGLSLSNLPDHVGIASKTKPLRDFFLTIFFVALGSELVIGTYQGIILPSIILSTFVLIGNPLIVLILMGLGGYKRRTSFLASVTVAQISEFSFILMAMGYSFGYVSSTDVSVVIMVGAITMTLSTYLILNAEKIYIKLSKYLEFFEKKTVKENIFSGVDINISNHIILVGCGRTGRSLLEYFSKKSERVLIVDHDPNIFKALFAQGREVILGDITDSEIAEKLFLNRAKLIICAISLLPENMAILEMTKKISPKTIFIGSVQDRHDALLLYEKGASYVLVPEIIAGEFLRHIFRSYGTSNQRIHKIGQSHYNKLMYAKA